MLREIKTSYFELKSILVESLIFLVKNPYLYLLCLIVESRPLIFSLTSFMLQSLGANIFIAPLNLLSAMLSIVLIGWPAVVIALQLRVHKGQTFVLKDLWPLIKKYFGKLFSFKVIELFLFCMFLLFTFSQSGKKSDFLLLLTDSSYQTPVYLSVLTFLVSIFYFYFNQVLVKMVVDDSTISVSLKRSIKYVMANFLFFTLNFLIRTLYFLFVNQFVFHLSLVSMRQIFFFPLSTLGILVINYVFLIKYLKYNFKK